MLNKDNRLINKAFIDTLRQASSNKQKAECIDSRRQLSMPDLWLAVENTAHELQALGTDRLAFIADNSIDWLIMDLACQSLNLLCVPIPRFFSPQQVQHCLQQVNIEWLFSDDGLHPTHFSNLQAKLYKQPPLQHSHFQGWRIQYEQSYTSQIPVGTQKITFTSGSTGEPKGVCLSLNQQWRVAEAISEQLKLEHRRHLCLLPLATLLENVAGVYSTLLSGGQLILVDEQARGMQGSSSIDSSHFLQCIERHDPNTIVLTPQLLSVLVQACEQGWCAPSSLDFIAVGGAKVSESMISKARALGLPLYQGYGLSECGSVVSLNTPQQDCPDSVGKVLNHAQVHIEDREIIVSGSCFLGYVNQIESWYPNQIKTGDYGQLHNGFLFVDGRKKNLLISNSARNINPEWIESEILSNTHIQFCVVLGDAEAYLSALIVADENFDEIAIDTWLNQVNANLPDYAHIKKWLRLHHARYNTITTENGRAKRRYIKELLKSEYQSLYPVQSTDVDSISTQQECP